MKFVKAAKWFLTALIFPVGLLGCGEPTFSCQHAPPKGKTVVFSVAPDVTPEEEALFLKGGSHWKDWAGVEIKTDRSLPLGRPGLNKVNPDGEAAFDAITHESISYTLYAVEENTGIWFVRSRNTDEELETVFAHEIGHSLGLGHDSEKGSLMYMDPKKFEGELTDIDHKDIEVCYVKAQ